MGAPATPPSALTRSRAIWTPAYSCFASGAWGPLSGKRAPTLMLAAPSEVGAVAQAAHAKTSPMAASCRNRTRWILDRELSSARLALPRSPAFLPALVHVHQGLPSVAAARARPRRRQTRPPPEQEADAQGDHDGGDDRASQLDLLDALDQDGDERAQRGDADSGVEGRRDLLKGQAKCGGSGGGEHREGDPRG